MLENTRIKTKKPGGQYWTPITPAKGSIFHAGSHAEKIIHIDTLPVHGKYGDVFLYTDVPEAERTEVAVQVADRIFTELREELDLAKVG
jgi:hypothetical protein